MGLYEESGGTTEADVVVIGSGATGLAAALTVAEGGSSVIIFEKQRGRGGSSNFAEGMFGVETEMQRQNYINTTRDEAFKIIMEYSHWRANPHIVRAFVNESASTIHWLQEQGVEFDGPMAVLPDGFRTWHLLKGPSHARASVMIKKLIAKAEKRKIDLRIETSVKKIIREGDWVIGVIAEKGGKSVTVNAKAVIIATEGYANNKEWIKKYTGFNLDDDLYAKDPRYLRPLKGPKFYALGCFTGFFATLGGIKVNHKMEVLDKEEKVIPELYAGGNDAGGMYGDSYDIYAAGSALGFAVNSGRIAARNALKYIGKKI